MLRIPQISFDNVRDFILKFSASATRRNAKTLREKSETRSQVLQELKVFYVRRLRDIQLDVKLTIYLLESSNLMRKTQI